MSAQTNCNCIEINQRQLDQFIDEDDSITIFQMVNQLKKIDPTCAIRAYDMEIEYFHNHKKLSEMLASIQAQEKQIKKANCHVKYAFNVNLNYSKYYRIKEDYEKMSSFIFKALADAELQKDKKNELKAIFLIVHLFTRQDQHEKNWAYIKRAENLILNSEQDYTTATNYNWLAFEFETTFTNDSTRFKILDSVLQYASIAKSLAVRYKNYEQITKSFRAFEAVSCHKGNLNQALDYIDSALYYAKKIKKPTNLGSLYFAKAWDYLELNNSKEAIRWQDTSFFYAEKYEHGTPGVMNLYYGGSRLYERAGNLPKALEAFRTYEHIKDSVYKIKRSQKINELELQYHKAKNEKTILELAQEKRIYLLLAIAGLLALITLIFFIRQISLKSKHTILETEQRLNRARMNPHFFFNALSSLQTFALQGNDGKSIAVNLSKFSHIMRETLESTYKEYVSIEEETDFLNKYLELQKMRFPQKFSYQIESAATIEIDEILIPSMVLQPFVENSIEHGFTGIDYSGDIKINFTVIDKELSITIADNGKGLGNTEKESNNHISRASQIIKDRIYLLNKKLKTNARFSIINNHPQKGVTVSIVLPLLNKHEVDIKK